jgi:hypothetical protein
MKEDIKNIWVEELRSGKYEQNRGALRNNGRDREFCCLGVLCDIHAKLTKTAKWEFVPEEGMNWYRLNDTSIGRDDGVLPYFVKEWADMKSPTGDISETECLSAYNDSGKTFNELADIIEENWEKL